MEHIYYCRNYKDYRRAIIHIAEDIEVDGFQEINVCDCDKTEGDEYACDECQDCLEDLKKSNDYDRIIEPDDIDYPVVVIYQYDGLPSERFLVLPISELKENTKRRFH